MNGPRIDAVRLLCDDVARTAAFYRAAFGCRDAPDGEDACASPATPCRLLLGRQRLELVTASRPPGPSAASNSTAFQHLAIVVTDMGAAVARLAATGGWRAISREGPETLPAASGGVTAFKFRDPEDHPLEFLQFAAGKVPPSWRAFVDGRAGTSADASAGGGRPDSICLGIDHTAITVADTERAVAFYRGIGFTVSARQVNHGAEQQRLDDIDGARVEVTGLDAPGGERPGLELLCYVEPGTLAEAVHRDERRATRTLLAGVDPDALVPGADVTAADGEATVQDPDGHRLG